MTQILLFLTLEKTTKYIFEWFVLTEKVVCDEPGEYATCAPCPMGYYKNKGAARKVCAQCGCGTGTPKEGATKCISKL